MRRLSFFPALQIKRIYIQNPTGTIISQWENVQMSSGIHQMEMQLAVEPEQVPTQYASLFNVLRDLCFFLFLF